MEPNSLVLTLNYLTHEGLTHYSGSIRVNYKYRTLVSELTGGGTQPAGSQPAGSLPNVSYISSVVTVRNHPVNKTVHSVARHQ